MENTKLKLYFKDKEANSKSVTIDYPKEFYEDSEIAANMDQMLASEVLKTKNGPVDTKVRAELETVNRKKYNI